MHAPFVLCTFRVFFLQYYEDIWNTIWVQILKTG